MKARERLDMEAARNGHQPGRLYEMALSEEADETMGVRAFKGIEGFQGTAKTDWDMAIDWPAWLNEVHNSKSGRIFIFGSGPSLRSQFELLDKMRDEDTWTVNRLHAWSDLPFTPTYHSIAEPGPIGAWGRFIYPLYDFPEAGTRIAISWWPVTARGWLWCPKAPDDIQLRWEGTQGLSERLSPLVTAWASPLTSSQLALWMGYTEICFLGMDTTQKGQAWDAEKGRTAEPRNVRSILECAERLSRDIKRAGRTILDCTPGGRLNREGALDYTPLEEVLDKA